MRLAAVIVSLLAAARCAIIVDCQKHPEFCASKGMLLTAEKKQKLLLNYRAKFLKQMLPASPLVWGADFARSFLGGLGAFVDVMRDADFQARLANTADSHVKGYREHQERARALTKVASKDLFMSIVKTKVSVEGDPLKYVTAREMVGPHFDLGRMAKLVRLAVRHQEERLPTRMALLSDEQRRRVLAEFPAGAAEQPVVVSAFSLYAGIFQYFQGVKTYKEVKALFEADFAAGGRAARPKAARVEAAIAALHKRAGELLADIRRAQAELKHVL